MSYDNTSLTKLAVIADEVISTRLLDLLCGGNLLSGSVGNRVGNGQGQEDRDDVDDTSELHLGGWKIRSACVSSPAVTE